MPDNSEERALGPVVPLAKAEGAFLALAAGDALGWPQEMPRRVRRDGDGAPPSIEFRAWTRRNGGRYRPYDETIRAGEYSDDTQLTLAVARSRANHGSDWRKAFMRVELPLWTIYERGGGGATKRAAQAWRAGKAPWQSAKADSVRRYFDAGGNGVAMRVLPHALFLAGEQDPAVLVHDVVRDGVTTHGHPRALVGATAWAHAAWSLARRNRTLGFGELLDLLIDERHQWGEFPEIDRGADAWFSVANRVLGEPYERIWKRTADEMWRLLEQARNGIRTGALADDHAVLDGLGCFGRFRGAGTVTAAAAAYLTARHAAQPVQGVLRAAFEKGADTDTLAATTGGLLGCLAGDDWLPAPWRDVQDSGYLRSIARCVAAGPAGAEQRPVEKPAPPRSVLAELARPGNQEVTLGESTRAQATALPDPRPASNSITVRAWLLRTPEGQTLYVTRVEELKRPAGSRRTTPAPTSRQQTLPGTEPAGAKPQAIVAADTIPKTAHDSGDTRSLYGEFQSRLRILLKEGPVGFGEVERALDLVPGQARKWLKQAEGAGEIERVSRRPVKFALSRSRDSWRR